MKQISIFTLGGRYIFTLDSIEEVCIVFECEPEPIQKAIKNSESFLGYQFRYYRNENDISPASEYYYNVTTTWSLKDRNGDVADTDTNGETLAKYYGITLSKLEDAYINKTWLFRKYRVDKKVTINTNEKNDLL